MRYLLILMGLVCLALPTCAPAPEPGPETTPEPVFDQAAEEAAVRKANEQINAAWNKKDRETFSAFLDESTENWTGSTKGKAATMESILRDWTQSNDGQASLIEEIGIVFVAPDVAIHKARYESTGYLDENGNPEPPAKYLVARVMVKRNGKWLQTTYLSRPTEE